MNSLFFTGIVEDILDPLKLNRVRVRVFGVHSESLEDVPTKSLPWAICLNHSAAISGIGESTQYLNGTVVKGYFEDGESKQMPIIFGSMPGIPVSKKTFVGESSEEITSLGVPRVTSTVLPTADNTTIDTSGTPVDPVAAKAVVEPSGDSRKALKAALGKKESSNNYKAINQLGYIGKYQKGAAMLTDLGYVKRGTKNSGLTDPSNWTGKDGMTSRDAFLNSPTVQESAMDQELDLNEKRLNKMGVIDSTTTEQEKAGFLATSHLLGTGGARNMKNGISKKDANGVSGEVYYRLGYAAVSGKEPTVAPDAVAVDNPSREPSTVASVGVTQTSGTAGSIESLTSSRGTLNVGFSDPDGKYPRYIKEQDTNRLSRGQNIDKTIVPIKEESEHKGVPIANGKGAWDQSSTPYNAQYPFNKVFESESGHIFEFDDTPNNERINLHHKTGTFTEIDRNGTMVRKIVGDAYEIWERNGFVHIKGTVNITVEGNANILVSNNCELEISGDLNANVGGDANWSIGGNANWSVGGDWKTKTGGSESHTNAGTFDIDGSTVNLNSGTSTAGSLPSPTGTGATGAPEFGPLTLEPRGFTELSEFEGDELTPNEAVARQKTLSDAGLTDVVQIPPTVSEPVKADTPKASETPVTCSTFVSGQININDYISPSFKIKDLTKGLNIPLSQAGLKDTQLACNLKALAENVLEVVKKKYPDMIITSCLRAMGSNPRSQHPLGQAVDIQFTSKKSSEYLAIVKDLTGSIPFDQLILEYRSSVRRNGTPTTWIHISFSSGANKQQVFTMDNDRRIGEFGELRLIT